MGEIHIARPRAWSMLVGAALVGGLLLAGAAPAAAHPHKGRDAVIVKPGESIQAAVDEAKPGTTIIVRPGTYAEHVTITTDGIRLIGHGAKIVPPEEHPPGPCSFGEESVDGICAVGELEFPDPEGPPVVADPIEDVTIKGFTVKDFEGSGILFVGAEDPVVTRTRTIDNEEYGIARFFSSGGKITGNKASGSEEAGIYVGDSPDADVFIGWNVAFDNGLFGFFLRDAANGKLVKNRAHDNCVGAIVLNTGANVAGDWTFKHNKIKRNNKFCPGNEEEGTPPLSGTGVLIVSASDNVLKGNRITDHVPSGEVLFSGGVVVISFGEADPPSGNIVKGNKILRNEPDIFWDETGEGNVFRKNRCETSIPEGLC